MPPFNYGSVYTQALDAYEQKNFKKAIQLMENEFFSKVVLADYMLIDKKVDIPKPVVEECLYNLGVFYKEFAESLIAENIQLKKTTGTQFQITNDQMGVFTRAIDTFKSVLSIHIDHHNSIANIISILTTLSFCKDHDLVTCAKYLQDCLFYQPNNTTIHYNLGFVYQKLNKLELCLIHYKLCLSLITQENQDTKENVRLRLNCYYGIGNVYTSIKEWPSALHYLLQGLRINAKDPDLNNNLGIVYTEMRRTDLAMNAYTTAKENYANCVVSTNPNTLLSNIYLNMGHMFSYDGKSDKSIECYDNALSVNSNSVLAFQNKMMNLNYFFHELNDPMQLSIEHKKINSFYKKFGIYKFEKEYFASPKINIGFVSADFINHPVSYFIKSTISTISKEKFNVYCYSESIVESADTYLKSPNVILRLVKNMTAIEVANQMHKDNIHILIDLSGHTSGNRLDVFALKPAPIQITYVGYPNTTGLATMDYRITDKYADNEHSEKYYSEKLLYLPKCFLNYKSNVFPTLKDTPYSKNGYITFGSFNRLNKVTKDVIKVWNLLLEKVPNSRILFKTKGLLNKKVRDTFIENFGENKDRVIVTECTLTHNEHLNVYNEIDIAIDTFPYAGTTTSCEALLMGVPVLTLRDITTHFHAQNVTSSILQNSQLEFYICKNHQDFVDKTKSTVKKLKNPQFKKEIRKKFLEGAVCNSQVFVEDFQKLMEKVYVEEKEFI